MSVLPDGFTPHTRRSPLTDPWEPLFARNSGDQVELALQLRDAHCNSRGFAHGGLLCALADNAMGLSAVAAARTLSANPNHQGFGSAVTVSLNLDFIGSAQVGQWLVVTPCVLKTGKSLAFVESRICADGQLVARASATFRLLEAKRTKLPAAP
jgi:uncharacterized protein (TIGR00369 family)